MKLPQNGNKYKCGKNDLFSVVIAFRMLLAKEDFAEFKKSLNQIINQYMKKTGNLNQDLFFKAMGFPENWKNISRYKYINSQEGQYFDLPDLFFLYPNM